MAQSFRVSRRMPKYVFPRWGGSLLKHIADLTAKRRNNLVAELSHVDERRKAYPGDSAYLDRREQELKTEIEALDQEFKMWRKRRLRVPGAGYASLLVSCETEGARRVRA